MAKVRTHTYTVAYRMYWCDTSRYINVRARNKSEAYMLRKYEAIPRKEDGQAYAVWVESITYDNGNWRMFNTFEGKPY